MKDSKRIRRLIVCLLLTAGAHSQAALAEYQEIPLNFAHGGNQLEAMLIKPKGLTGPMPVVLFIHGDGETEYDNYGYYDHIWQSLAEVGIASFSWSKAGVGGSSGNWLHQSLEDRADETIAAINMLKTRDDVIHNKIGLIGWSQAGWVMPIVASKSDYPDFMILVSGAINWMDQGHYMKAVRMKAKGASQEEIDAVKVTSFRETEGIFSMSYKKYAERVSGDGNEPMDRDRFRFVQLNWRSDVREHLQNIDCPVLAILGGQDVNVDIKETARVYKEEFGKSSNQDFTIKIFPDAQHGLLKSRHFKAQVPGLWFLTKLAYLGEQAYVDGYLDLIANWTKQKTEH